MDCQIIDFSPYSLDDKVFLFAILAGQIAEDDLGRAMLATKHLLLALEQIEHGALQ